MSLVTNLRKASEEERKERRMGVFRRGSSLSLLLTAAAYNMFPATCGVFWGG